MLPSESNKQKISTPSHDLPLASIIITSYNYENFLPRAIDSALRQTYPVKEIIVVDDGSTDNSPQIINSYGDQIIPVFQENKGRPSAWNAGLLASRGEIIFLLDADDAFFPHKVETIVNYYLQVMPQIPEAMIFHRLQMTTDEGIMLSIKPRRLRTIDGQKKLVSLKFLNGILQKINKPRIISYYDSPQAIDYYRYCGSIKGLLKLAREIPARCFCRETMWFSIKTLWLSLKIVLGIKKGPRLTHEAKLFAKAKKRH